MAQFGTIGEINRIKLIELIELCNEKNSSNESIGIVLEGGEGATFVINEYSKNLGQIISVVLNPDSINLMFDTVKKVTTVEWCDFVSKEYSGELNNKVKIVWVGTEVDEFRYSFALRTFDLLCDGGILIFSNTNKSRVCDILTNFIVEIYNKTEKILIHPDIYDGSKKNCSLFIVFKKK